MGVNTLSGRGGDFATAPRGKASGASAFILEQHAKGLSPATIARMAQCCEADVRAMLPAPAVTTAQIRALQPRTKEEAKSAYQALRKSIRADRTIELPSRLRAILVTMCAEEKVTLAQVLGADDTPRIIEARYRAYWLLHRVHGCSLPKVGGYLGGRHHSSVFAGIRKHEQRAADLAAILAEAA